MSAGSSQGTWSNANGTVICDLGSVEAGMTAWATVTAAATTVGAESLVAEITSSACDFEPGNDRSTNTTTVSPVADLALTTVASPDPVYLGNTLTYTLTASNLGPYSASGVTVSNVLPSGVTFGSATASQGSCSQNNGLVTAALGELASGGQATVTIEITSPTNAGWLTNGASISATSPLDLASANNSSTTRTRNVPSQFVIIPTSAALVTESSPATGGIEAGETVSVCFYLKNIGSADTTNLAATLLANGGVTSPGAAMNYGALAAHGPSVGRTNTFTAATNADGVLTGTLQLEEGTINLGTVSFDFALGRQTSVADGRIMIIPEMGVAGLYPIH